MKIGRYLDSKGAAQVCVVDSGFVYPVANAPSTLEIIENFSTWRTALETAAADASQRLPLDAVKLVSPIQRPGKIMGIGFNYVDHAAEANVEPPKDQIWFSKAATAINGPFGDIVLPKVSPTLDYEVELVIVIGKRCRHVAPENAAGVIFGFCVGNDVSVREWQFKTTQFILGKSFDTHAPIGPWITTADSVDGANLDISLAVNGEVRQKSNTRHLYFKFGEMISQLSTVMTLEPGDLIFTGTPAGVAAVMKPPRWLIAGDVVRAEIEGLGAIENRVREE